MAPEKVRVFRYPEHSGEKAGTAGRLAGGRLLPERKLAAMYGKTSRRWARNRIAEARRIPASAMAGP
jgi:hypothetical protein